MEVFFNIIKEISGGKRVDYSTILFNDKNLPNSKLFEYLLYLDGIHDFPKIKSNLVSKIDGTKISNDFLFEKNILDLEISILKNIYVILRIYITKNKINSSIINYIRINNKNIKKNETFYDSTGSRTQMKDSLEKIDLLFKRKDNIEIKIPSIKKELDIKLYYENIKNDKKYLTKMFDGSNTQVSNIFNSEIDIQETLIIPEYFFYPNNKKIIGKVEFFWSFEKIYELDTKINVYPSLRMIFTKDGKSEEIIYVRKFLDFDENQEREKPIFNIRETMYRYLDKKVIKIKTISLPSGNSKITSYAIFGNNYLGRQFKNLGDLSMAYEASMKGLNLYTQDLIIASYYILFNFYKFLALEKIKCEKKSIENIKYESKYFLDIKSCEFGNLIIYNKKNKE
jgi:hypothetical protein